MKYLCVSLLLLLSIFSISSAEDWFPITAWGIKYDNKPCTSWVVDIADTFFANSTSIGCESTAVLDVLLNTGASHNVQFFVQQLFAYDYSKLDLSIIARGQYSLYESDEQNPNAVSTWPPKHGYFDSTYFERIGYRAWDTLAIGDSAWAVDTSFSAGYMQKGLIQHFLGHRQKYSNGPYSDTSLAYEAKFFLRIPNNEGNEEDPICRLEVWRDATESDTVDANYYLLDSTTIYRAHFSDTSAYDSFSLWHSKDTISCGKLDIHNMDYRIYWYDNYELYADRVEVRDTVYWCLQKGIYNDSITPIVDNWDYYPALRYYFLWDEPYLNQFESFNLLTQEMGDAKPSIATVNHRYKKQDVYGNYIEFIKECYTGEDTPLLADKYLLGPSDTTSSSIKANFDTLCNWMDKVRVIADTTDTSGVGPRSVWYVCQAHKFKQGSTVKLRDPTPQEIWALVGLGLAHGAKGILYYRYKSCYWATDTIWGLVDWNFSSEKWEKNEKWYAARNVNQVLQVIDTFLLDFDFQDAFYAEDRKANYIKYVSFDTTEFGLFEDSQDLKYFLTVSRRDTFSSVADTASDSTLITLGLDGSLHSGNYYIRDCYSSEAYGYDSTSDDQPPPDTLFFGFYLKDCHFRLFQIVPFACDVEINADSAHTDYQFVKVKLDTTTSLNFGGAGDSIFMTVWDNEGDTSSANINYDSTFIWKFDSPGQKIISASFKLKCGSYIHGDSGYLTPTYCDTIYFDTLPPDSNSVEVASDSLEGFVNIDTVDLALYSADIDASPIGKMRFSNYGFSNLIQNPEFTSSANWTCVDSAWADDGYGEIKSGSGYGGRIYQDIDDSLLVESALYRLSAYGVTEDFSADSGRVRIWYMHIDTISEATDSSIAMTIDLSNGDNALTGYNCLSDTFTYNPSPTGEHDTAFALRIETYQGTSGSGTVYVDNFLFEREYSQSYWKSYSTVETGWVLTSGNGEKVVWAEFRDRAGNISSPVSDTVILDATDPIRKLTYPINSQTISGVVTIKGWAYDSAAPDSHNYYYQLQYHPVFGGEWNDCDSAYYLDPKYPNTGQKDPSVALGTWNTNGVSDGSYYLKLTVVDSAVNADDTTITVTVSNFGKGGSGEFSAGKEPLGIGSFSSLYITDGEQGDLFKHTETGDSIGYCELEKDSLGDGEPCAIAMDSTGFWIADKYNHTVIYYEYDGDPIYKIGKFGEEKGEFNEPSGIALWDKKVYVTDRYNHRVQVFKEDELLFEFGSKGDSAGQFIEPLGITIDKYGWVYVVERGNNRIQAFDTTGDYIETFAKDIEFNNPCGIVADTFGCIFVVDQENFRIVELDPFGDPICEFGEKGDEEGQFLVPFDVAISEDGEKLFVTDRNLKKVVQFNIYLEDSGGPMSSGEDELPTINCLKACYPVPFSKGTNISYAIARGGHVSIKVYDITGRVIKKLVNGTQERGWYTIQWNGHNQNNKSVAAGVYFIRMETGNFLSTKKVLLVR